MPCVQLVLHFVVLTPSFIQRSQRTVHIKYARHSEIPEWEV